MKIQRRTSQPKARTAAIIPMLPVTAVHFDPIAPQAQRPAAPCILRWLSANTAARRTNPALLARLA